MGSEMLADIERERQEGLKGPADYASVMPDVYTKSLVRKLIKQLRTNGEDGEIDPKVAKETLEVPLKTLSDLDIKAMERSKKKAEIGDNRNIEDDGEAEGEAVESLEKSELEV